MPGHLPTVAHALIGGSATAAISFPEDLGDPRVRVVAHRLVAATPFGDCAPLTHIAVRRPDGSEREALVARMHGWTPGTRRSAASLALFAALRTAGVTRVVSESGAGSITQNFTPRDIVIPHDVLDLTPQVCGILDPEHTVVMRAPFCPEVRAAAWDGAQRVAKERSSRAFDRGVPAATEGTRFETAAEVAAFARLGADLVGAGVCPEVFLAREIGACFGAVCVVLNYAEGVRPRWDERLLDAIVHEDARLIGRLMIDALIAVPDAKGCGCAGFRRAVGTEPTGVAALTDTA